MTTNDTSYFATEEFLDPYIESARQQFDAAQIEHAARRLRESLPQVRVGRRARFSWLSLAGAVSILFAAITVMSFFLPGENGSAFAQAQQWFSSFRTLHVETTLQTDPYTETIMNAWLNDSGDLRIEANGVATIIKSEEGMIYTLLPDGQTIAQSIPLDSVSDDPTKWLADIRDFQGKAELLDESRSIEGIAATGYRLTTEAATFVLWVDPLDSKPMLVEAEMPVGVTMRNALSFDIPLPVDAFDVPDGAQPLLPHD